MERQNCSYTELIKHYAMEVYGVVDVEIRIFLTLALVGDEWSVSHPGRSTPRTYWIGGWVGLQSCSGQRDLGTGWR
jgi:hypothetical protein